jgi:hypothetical protein
MALDLTIYPAEILNSILLLYCDHRDLLNLWLAVCGCNQHVAILWPLLQRLTEKRLDVLIQDRRQPLKECSILELEEEETNNNHATTTRITTELRRQQTRSLSERLLLIDYGQHLHSVIWCGRMEFSIPRHLRFHDKLEACVKLCCDDENWSFQAMHAWNIHFPPSIPIVELRSQLYNFVPVPPFGRLKGVTRQDQEIIQRVRSELEETNQVMTLRFTQMKIILRIISPDQARRRSFPGLLQKFENFSDGLLCCWEISDRWEDERTLSRNDKLQTIASTLNRYRTCDTKYDFKWHLFRFFEDQP